MSRADDNQVVRGGDRTQIMEARKQREGEKETVAADKELGRRTTFIPVPVDDVMAQRATFGFGFFLVLLFGYLFFIREVLYLDYCLSM